MFVEIKLLAEELFSDLLANSYGVECLRYVLMAVVPVALTWSGLRYVLAGRLLRADLTATLG